MQPAPRATWQPSWQQPATVSAWSWFLLHPSRQIGTALILQPPNELSLAATLSSASPTVEIQNGGACVCRVLISSFACWSVALLGDGYRLTASCSNCVLAEHLLKLRFIPPATRRVLKRLCWLLAKKHEDPRWSWTCTILRNKETRWHLIIQHAASLIGRNLDNGAFWEGPNTASLYTKSFMNSRRWTAQRSCGRMNSLVNLRMGQKKHFWLTNSWIDNWYLCFFR